MSDVLNFLTSVFSRFIDILKSFQFLGGNMFLWLLLLSVVGIVIGFISRPRTGTLGGARYRVKQREEQQARIDYYKGR